METVRMVRHKNTDIIIVDVSQSQNNEESIAILDQAEKLIRTQPERSVRIVTNVANVRYDVTAVEAMKNFSYSITPYVLASTVVGLSGIKSVIYRAIIRITGRKITPFDTLEQAMDWLAEQ